MRFGPMLFNIIMNNRIKLLFAAVLLLAYSCKHNSRQENNITLSPEAGTSYKAGDVVKINIIAPSGTTMDSVVYLVDSVRIASRKDSSAISLKTDTIPLGIKLITAKVYADGKAQEVSTNIVLMAAKAPEKLTYKVIKKFPHDTSAYTEGLLYQDGFFYESTGSEGHSTLRKVDVATGKVVQEAKLDAKIFGEGISIVGDKIIMLTYHQPETAFIFDKNTFKLLGTFNNPVGVEGWGMTFDGNKLYFDDSTNRIYFLDKNTYHQTGFIDVYTDKAPVDSVNELEYIDGKLYSNIYQHDNILVIDPKTGAVLQNVDMKNLWPVADHPKDFDDGNNVLNGIAWDEKGKRLFVTGKKWPYLYQVEFVKK
jgi:glutamine cyclotransferase